MNELNTSRFMTEWIFEAVVSDIGVQIRMRETSLTLY